MTGNLERLTGFYRDVLGFALTGAPQSIEPREMSLLGLSGRGQRQVLSIGRQTVSLDHYETAGQPYPAAGNAASPWFQHLALVVEDMALAYQRLRDVTAISTGGPQRLPATSGGVDAFKFRDPDGHPLELLRFPRESASPNWRDASPIPGQIALGIDHSAISVADASTSRAFYGGLGLKSGAESYNKGPAQECLDGIPGVEVRVVPLLPRQDTPHLELLGYRVPSPTAIKPWRANDIAATRIVWRGDAAELLRDPTGHLHQVEAP